MNVVTNTTKNYIAYCHHCEQDVMICGKCGNNTCNGGYGEIDGVQCDQCPQAYKEYMEMYGE
jgi:hypothetical protein